MGNTERRAGRALRVAAGVIVAAQFLTTVVIDGPLRVAVRFEHLQPVLQQAAALPRSPDVLLVGSSRFESLVDVAEMHAALAAANVPAVPAPVVFRAVVPAADPVTQELMLDHLFDLGLKPRLLLLEVCPDTVMAPNRFVSWHLTRQLRWVDLPDAMPDVIGSWAVSRLLSSRLIPLFLYRAELLELFLPSWLRPELPASTETAPPAPPPAVPLPPVPRPADLPAADADVWPSLDPEAAAEFAAHARAAADSRRRWFQRYAIGGIGSRALERILRRCREARVRVVLVRPPAHSRYRALLVPEAGPVFAGFIDGVTASSGAAYADYASRVPDVLFRDDTHAIHAGARLFSRHLARELIAPWWREAAPQRSTMPMR